jgi:signal transduction histidine kinase
MLNFISGHFSRGIALARNNPQIIYTIFLMVALPLAFFVSGQRFLDAANENQERLEKESISHMQDSFVAIAPEKINDSEFLNRLVFQFKKDNDSIEEFIVVKKENDSDIIIASLDASTIGSVDALNEPLYKNFESLMKESSVIFPASKNNGRHWLAYRAISDTSGNTIGFLMTDISMQHIDSLAARSISSAYTFLAFIVLLILVLLVRQARIVDYTVLYRRLKEVDKMKDDFVSMAAHELRTPLTIIRGYVDLLKDVKNLEDKDRENLRRIDVSAKGLNALIGDILDVSRLEQGRMSFEFEEIDIDTTLATITESFQSIAKEKGLILSYLATKEQEDTTFKISADKERLRQILTNIIGNAVKYTPTGSVAVHLSFDELKNKVITRVSDTGFGISAEDQKRLFEKFFRVKNAETGSIQGTGLGLWITREMVLNMKGEISVESIKGKGTDFILSFPAVVGKK